VNYVSPPIEQYLKFKNHCSLLNNLEQHHHGWSARILNIPLPDGDHDNDTVRDTVYNLALLPILRGAASKNLLLEVSTADQLLKVATCYWASPAIPGPSSCGFTIATCVSLSSG
jgi:hypothetical protein